MFIEYILIFIAAATPWLEIALVIPLGIIRGLSPFWVMVSGFTGNLSTVILLIIGFEKVKTWLAKRKEKKGETENERSKRSERAHKIWNKYGLPGLTLLGPVLIGIHIAIFIGMSLGAKKNWTMLWSTISLVVWTLTFGILTMLGFDFFVRN
ncbi:small multi-drug export protein [Robertmurraya sp. FSL W8-0741]|uniref:small multi-drug export protein n=1 Tax=Robertmurraya TaxID=2837507 RepID=UPI0010F99A35|nr:small multi-drug export protein [Robertmurraya siralis]